MEFHISIGRVIEVNKDATIRVSNSRFEKSPLLYPVSDARLFHPPRLDDYVLCIFNKDWQSGCYIGTLHTLPVSDTSKAQYQWDNLHLEWDGSHITLKTQNAEIDVDASQIQIKQGTNSIKLSPSGIEITGSAITLQAPNISLRGNVSIG